MIPSVGEQGHCGLCGCPEATTLARASDSVELDCPNCGSHKVSRSALSSAKRFGANATARARLGYLVRRVPPGGTVSSDLVSDKALADPLPSPLERVDLLVETLAGLGEPGIALTGPRHTLLARLGCESPAAVGWVIEQAEAQSLVVRADSRTGPVLTVGGWARADTRRRGGSGSRRAFMAMAFNEEMWTLLRDHLQPAVKATDFDLRPVAGDHQTAGSIDDRMRVEIRNSRFVICDLTHNNRGAYWEGGFAEGLGRPVFYTCRRDVLQEERSEHRPHFDTAHQLIIPWALESIKEDMGALKSAIRATLPAEAKLED